MKMDIVKMQLEFIGDDIENGVIHLSFRPLKLNKRDKKKAEKMFKKITKMYEKSFKKKVREHEKNI